MTRLWGRFLWSYTHLYSGTDARLWMPMMEDQPTRICCLSLALLTTHTS